MSPFIFAAAKFTHCLHSLGKKEGILSQLRQQNIVKISIEKKGQEKLLYI